MCEDLGINIIAANTPQAKGKVEKVITNGKDHHYRLVVGTTREAIDEYLSKK